MKQINKECDRLRSKIISLKNQKKNSFLGPVTKTCMNCKNEYKDSENFNWSCRTHPSDWGGSLWWCCGKSDPNHLGCKFGKHVSKDDQENEEQDLEDINEKNK